MAANLGSKGNWVFTTETVRGESPEGGKKTNQGGTYVSNINTEGVDTKLVHKDSPKGRHSQKKGKGPPTSSELLFRGKKEN